MWFDVLPPLAIIGVSLVLPQLIPYYVEKRIYGNPIRRSFCTAWDGFMADRDESLTGSWRKIQGLEAIPDK